MRAVNDGACIFLLAPAVTALHPYLPAYTEFRRPDPIAPYRAARSPFRVARHASGAPRGGALRPPFFSRPSLSPPAAGTSFWTLGAGQGCMRRDCPVRKDTTSGRWFMPATKSGNGFSVRAAPEARFMRGYIVRRERQMKSRAPSRNQLHLCEQACKIDPVAG